MFIFFLLLLYIICLTGCKENDEKINIDFIIDGISHIVQIDKGTSIIKEVVPLNDNIVDFELYYDENMKNNYIDEKLYENIRIYVKYISLTSTNSDIIINSYNPYKTVANLFEINLKREYNINDDFDINIKYGHILDISENGDYYSEPNIALLQINHIEKKQIHL